MKLIKLQKWQKTCWFFLIAALPFTSMPFVRKLMGSDSVGSPAIIFLFVLVFLIIAGIKFEERVYFSSSAVPLILFCCFAFIATILSFFYDSPAFKGFNQISPVISASGTLMIGLLFFNIASTFPFDDSTKKTTLRIINWSGLAILFWCLLQGLAWYGSNHYPQWMFNFQGLLSERVLYRQRVTGFALEPSWLAHQLNMLYLPIWLSASLTGYTSHNFKFRKISFENLLLIFGVLTLSLTLSRVGFAAFLCMAIFAIIILVRRFVPFTNPKVGKKEGNHKGIQLLLILAVTFVFILVVVLLVYTYSKVDPRMANLFKFSDEQDNSLLRYFDQLKFGDRVVYWLTGWNIFNKFPIMGVGLGNAGFYFPQNIPAYGFSLTEVRNLLYRSNLLLNIKSLWFRLLAETGIIGFSIFVGWLLSLISNLIEKYQSVRLLEHTLSIMGFFVLLALPFEGLSVDSFALPYWWISLGLAVSLI